MEIVTPSTKDYEAQLPLAFQHPLFQQLSDKQVKQLQWTSLLLALFCYGLLSSLLDQNHWACFPLVLSLMAINEWLNKGLDRPWSQPTSSRLEYSLFTTMSLAQGMAVSIWGWHPQMEVFQVASLALSLLLYLAARNGSLNQGRLGIMVWLDLFYNGCFLPFRYFVLSLEALTYPTKPTSPRTSKKWKSQLGFTLISLVVSGLLIQFVISQLNQVSQRFFQLTDSWTQGIAAILHAFLTALNPFTILSRIVLTFPMALALFGLVVGSILGKKKLITYKGFIKSIQPIQVFPTSSLYIIITSLCLIYTLFFTLAIGELHTILASQISAPDASNLAVSGFWQLVRVSLLNFTVLAGLYLLTKPQVLFGKASRWLLTLLFSFAFLFALLAAWKLFGIYIHFYGPTPLRLLSGWFITVLLNWCMLVLVRLHKPIQAIRWGILYAFISFTVLVFVYGFLLV